jgi:penicillin-binding protein 1A
LAKKDKYKEEELDKYLNDKEYRKKVSKKNRKANNVLGTAVVFILIGIICFAGYLVYLAQGLPSLAELENPKLEEATKVYSADGELIDKFFLKNRTKVTIENIPKEMINALVATEDRKFFDHWGFDLDRTIKAVIKNILSFRERPEGASTITQQLARNMYPDIGKEVSINRKLREAMTSIQIERTYTKQEILAYYLNTVYFGKGAYGVEAAAQTYFNKSAKDLLIDECAILVGVLKNPSKYDPADNPEESKKRRNIVLNSMVEMGYISQEQYKTLSDDPIRVTLQKNFATFNSPAPQFTEMVRQQLEQKAEKYGYDLYRDGLQIYTTLDTRFQKHAMTAATEQLKTFQKEFNGYWNWKNNKDILNDAVERQIKVSDEYKKGKSDAERSKIAEKLRKSQSFIDSVKVIETTVQLGFVCMNPKTGEIKAMVGANPNNTFKYGLNHVTQIQRQPGSTFKVFVYTEAIANGYSPGYMISNDPVAVNVGGKIWSPKGGGTGGSISLRDGIAKSVNVIAVRTAMEIAPLDKVIQLAHDMGVKSELPNVLSLVLGAGEVTPLEMTNAFGTIANEGIWVEPIAITKICDRNGNIIEELRPDSREVLSEDVAYIMQDMMEGVVDEGTATSIRQFFSRPAAGKTGTTNDYTDAWFIGFTPQFLAGVWLGFDDPRVKFGGGYGQGGKAAAPIWGRFMKYLYADDSFDFPVAYFQMPDGVEEASICSISGMLDNGSCPSHKELVLKKFLPKKCNVSHSLPSEGTQESNLPPEGSVGF